MDSTLHYAARFGDVDAVNEALAAGAEVNAVNKNGTTPLSLASAKGHEAVVGALLAAGAVVNATNNHGDTPLDIARRDSVRAKIQAHIEGKFVINRMFVVCLRRLIHQSDLFFNNVCRAWSGTYRSIHIPSRESSILRSLSRDASEWCRRHNARHRHS